jgi:haloacetate dehalogenase
MSNEDPSGTGGGGGGAASRRDALRSGAALLATLAGAGTATRTAAAPPGPPPRLPGFAYRRIDTAGARINVATAGEGPPLLLLHGYPETHLMWRHVAPALAREFAVVCMDLRGYGDSSAPEGGPGHANYAKRAMAQDALEVMAALGHPSFLVGAHDRGARVAYRLALDHPDAVRRLALLDIVSTRACYEDGGTALAEAYFHWYFLIQPHPLPERLIGGDPRLWLDWFLPGDLEPAIRDEYLRTFGTPSGVHATCEDYRAGATLDLAHDRADVAAGRRIACPTLVLWGRRGAVGRTFRPLETWRDLVAAPTGEALDCGHFLAEERPAETLAALRKFFA